MLSVLSLGATCGTEVMLEADGEGAEAALTSLADLLARDLDAEETAEETAGKAAAETTAKTAEESADA